MDRVTADKYWDTIKAYLHGECDRSQSLMDDCEKLDESWNYWAGYNAAATNAALKMSIVDETCPLLDVNDRVE